MTSRCTLTMRSRTDAENLAIVAAVLLCVAFVASAVIGLRGGGSVAGEETVLPSTPMVQRSAGRLEVLNASGRGGAARHVTDLLRTHGFDVVFFGNAPAAAGDSSAVLDRSGNDAVARAAARALGISVVETRRDTTLYLDATVIVGVDWAPPQQSAPIERAGWRRALDWVRPGR
jgi:hypothetical protein